MGVGTPFTPAQAGGGLIHPGRGRAAPVPSLCAGLAWLGWRACYQDQKALWVLGASSLPGTGWDREEALSALPLAEAPRADTQGAPTPWQRPSHRPDRREASGASQGSFSGREGQARQWPLLPETTAGSPQSQVGSVPRLPTQRVAPPVAAA